VQAFQSLLRSLLTKSDAELSKWRDALRQALDPNGHLIVDLIPELTLIIGNQAPVPELPLQDARRRFHMVFRSFISVFARPEHPLALFLDDLQWLDAAALDLIEDVLSQADVRHLMLIGAYRDNEVDATHPLMRKLEAIRQRGAIVHDIVLAPLAPEDVEQLIVDTLLCEPDRAKPLAQLVEDKTRGNPFFAIRFIVSLAEEGLLTFDHGEGRWSWDLKYRVVVDGAPEAPSAVLKIVNGGSDGWSTPTSLGFLPGILKGRFLRRMTHFFIWWDTTRRISCLAVCVGRS
jgi:predicted ATPase